MDRVLLKEMDPVLDKLTEPERLGCEVGETVEEREILGEEVEEREMD